MALKYDIRKKKSSLTGNTSKYYAQVVKQGDFSFDEIVQEITARSSASPGDVVGVLQSMVDVLAERLSEGDRVHVGVLGSFMARVSSSPIADPNQTRGVDAHCTGIQYTPSKYLKDKMRHTHIQHCAAPFRMRGSREATLDELRQTLLNVLDEQEMITRPDYGRLTGRLRFKAQQDLDAFVAEGWLMKCGQKPFVYYRKIESQLLQYYDKNE